LNTHFNKKETAAYSAHHTVMSSNFENEIESTDFYLSKHSGHLTEILKTNIMPRTPNFSRDSHKMHVWNHYMK
jgi:hypothetical protein